MARSRRPRRRKRKRRYETTGTIVLDRAQVVRAPMSRRVSPWTRILLRMSLILLVLVGAVALWVTLDRRFYVYHAEVAGVNHVSPEVIFEASGLSGLHILWTGSKEIESRIVEALPVVKSAKVACWPPANCTITVEERQPMVTWDEDGKLWWVDGDGVVFPADRALSDGALDEAVQGWVVRGPLPRDDDDRLKRRVRIALSELWESGAEIPLELYYVPGRGLVFIDEHGWRVILGQGAGMAERLRMWEQVTAYLESQGLTPRFVDVRFPDAPYYSLENEW